jgi:hypothetical protein
MMMQMLWGLWASNDIYIFFQLSIVGPDNDLYGLLKHTEKQKKILCKKPILYQAEPLH